MATTASAQSEKGMSAPDAYWSKNGVFAGYKPEQEIVEKRTRMAKHFRNADGTFTVQTGGVYHYKGSDGTWQDIDLTIHPNGQQGFENLTNEFKSAFPQTGTGGVTMTLNDRARFSWWNRPGLRLTTNGSTLSEQHTKAVTGTVQQNNLVYTGAYEGISEEFVMLQDGIENNTIVHALNPDIRNLPTGAVLEFTQFIPLQTGWTVAANGITQSGHFTASSFHISIPQTTDGIYFSPVVAFDRAVSRDQAFYALYAPADKLTAAERQQKANNVYQASYDVRFVSGGIEVATKMPADWLKAAGRTFPVTIDPTVTITPPSPTGNYYAPISHWYGFQRHANLYLSSEIGTSNINITAIEYNRTTTAGTNAVKPAKVFMRTTTATTFTGTPAWNSTTLTGGLTALYNASADFHGTTTGFKMITLATSFLYTTDNLVVMVYDEYGSTGSAKYMNRSSTVTGRQLYKRQDNTDPGDASATAVENYLPEIRITYTAATNIPPSCVSAPLTPANNSTTVCSGTTLLRWAKVANATSYDVYLDAGTASPTTIVSANQTDTFYNATTVVGPYKWRVIPKNVNGPATGCSDFAFTTVANVTPTVSVSVAPNDTVCAGMNVTFTATHVNGGTTPVYQWKKNGATVGGSGSTYSSSALVNKDTIIVVMTSNSSACLTSNTATSTPIVMTILPVPVTTISVAGPPAFCAGGSVTLNASSTGIAYQWLRNSSPIAGATGTSYVANIAGRYRMQATGSNGCSSVSDSITVTVYSKPFPPVNRIDNTLSTNAYYTSYQWYRGGQAIPGANSYQYTLTQDGMYMVHVGDTAGCEGNSAPVPVNSLAVGGVGAANDISVYPNPASGMVYINGPAKVNVAVRSVDGKLVLAKENVSSIDISSLARGLYHLYITDKNLQLLRVEKLVKAVD